MPANKERKPMETFTLMVLDLDDTLIPTSIRQFLYKNFRINIFKSLQSSLLKQLQLNIVRSLQNIQRKLTESSNDPLEIALISNATSKWLKRMLLNNAANSNKRSKEKDAYFTILYKYFVCNNVSIHSSKEDNNYRDDPESNKKNLWILKYKSISALVAKKEQELKRKCTQIVSFGDGFHEKKALRVYSEAKDVRCIHFELVKAPTITQLNKQWEMLSNEIDIASLVKMNYFVYQKNITKKQSKTIILKQSNYLVYTMNDAMDVDNNEECTGEHQLSAISKYFGIWIKTADKKKKSRSKKSVKGVAEKVNLKRRFLKRNNKYENSSYQKVVDIFCGHKEFKNTLRNVW